MSTSRRLRLIASAGAAAVAAASLSVVAAPGAQAATTPYELTWGVSQYLNEHLTAQAFSGGASEDASGIVTFTSGVAHRDTAAGATLTEYQGDARYAFNNPSSGTELYSVTFSDPTIVVSDTGSGRILADVAWSVTGGGSGSVSDATVTTFQAGSSTWSGFTLSATPDWAGVAPADTYGTGKPVDGKSWAVDFVKAVPSSLNPFFYASGSGNDVKKPPAAFTAEIPPSVVVTGSSFSPTQVAFTVAGQRFTAVTNPGDAGVYVGLAPSGGLPDVSTQTAMSSFAAAAYVVPGQISGGAFTTTLSTTPDKLRPGTAYSIYTWQAHAHSNTTQDTETPVTIDWASLTAAPAPATPVAAVTQAKATVTKKPTTTRKGALAVTITSAGATPSGKITVKLTKKGAKAIKRSATLKQGKATVALPRLKAGRWKATVSYAGTSAFQAVTDVVTFKVAKVKKTKQK